MLNDAFRTLRDPVARAEYFLQPERLELSKEAPPELLEEVFELNMALEELRGGDESARPQLVVGAGALRRHAGRDRREPGRAVRGAMTRRRDQRGAGRDSRGA